MAEQTGVEVVVGLTGFQATTGGVTARGEQFVRVQLPPAVTEEHLELMRNDLRLLSQVLDENPRTLLDIHNAVLRNDMPTANRLAREVGLTEENAQGYGGGMWGYILVAGVIIFAYAAFGGEGESPPPPPPPPPPPTGDAGAPDAGPG
jgi:hypothetical protein